jgi:hypothetical protein
MGRHQHRHPQGWMITRSASDQKASSVAETHVMNVNNWTPEGKIIYSCLSNPLDRFEGTTQGADGVVGLLLGAGVDEVGSVSPGDWNLGVIQRLIHAIGVRLWKDLVCRGGDSGLVEEPGSRCTSDRFHKRLGPNLKAKGIEK